MLHVKDVEKVYDSGDRALKGLSMDVSGNEIVSIIGPSGAGKSTLIRCINRLTEPTDGEIWLDDTEITGLSGSQLRETRRDMGMIHQEFNLVERLTVMENVLSGRLGYMSTWDAFRRNFDSEDIATAREVLRRVGLEGVENDRADELSGGQRQRVGIARAVIQRPKILLVDEPTSALDPETSVEVMDLLTEIAREDDIPVLINIHEVDLATEYADRVVGLSDGELVFEGAADELDERAQDIIYRGGQSRAERDAAKAERAQHAGE
ncbi:phosphonate ABC transporter ATP-binding protein [Haloferax larsenii]|uniref:Phosphonate ABC transporter ATP-binding protein n=1 Tax=Haloferax larsenii TaxID=302484 RepID=A0ABY5RF54_HALLR|nr:phosphonate ABC transporter ATP-binding protein [Haloferax larsenii]ELZ80336.1 phosphonates ABC transporter ATP-binding protein [Haloferax larsenii JCM 13917]UVE50997.1 phosphonate ABC transporter ATP-binding protein [Haloferax larsenii]